jgi:hypothetical protein
MAKSDSSDLWSRIAPTPLKGFIEFIIEERRILVAISNIISVADRGADGCVLTIREHSIGLSSQAGSAYLKNSYDEVVALLKQAQ